MTKKQLADKCAKTYLYRCTNERVFTNGRLCKSYFMLRKHFLTKEDDELERILSYLDKLDKCEMTLTEVYTHMGRAVEEEKVAKREQEVKDNLSKMDAKDAYSLDDFLGGF